MYRKPNSDIDNFFNFYNEVLDKICKGKQYVIITGDFNIDILPENLSNSSDTFININSSYGLQNLIKIPTRITNMSSTLIDNIFSNISNVKCQSGTICTDKTDHLPIFSFFKNVNLHNTSQSSPKYFRKITKEGIDSLQKELYSVDWSFLYSLKDVEQMYEASNSKLLFLYNKCLPLTLEKEKKLKIRKPWLTVHLLKCIRRKNKLYKKFIQDKSAQNEQKF